MRRADIAQRLLSNPAHPKNLPNHAGDTPLHIATKMQSAKLVGICLQYDPETINAKNNEDATPLHYAKSAVIRTCLIEAGADQAAAAISTGTEYGSILSLK